MATKTIWKFPLQPECEIAMPKGAQLLSVREQGFDEKQLSLANGWMN